MILPKGYVIRVNECRQYDVPGSRGPRFYQGLRLGPVIGPEEHLHVHRPRISRPPLPSALEGDIHELHRDVVAVYVLPLGGRKTLILVRAELERVRAPQELGMRRDFGVKPLAPKGLRKENPVEPDAVALPRRDL